MGPEPRSALLESDHRLWTSLKGCVRIDTRTLAVFRILVGALAVADLLLRSRNFTYFYTETGVVPRSLAMEYSGYSIFHLTTSTTVIAALFVVHGLVALQLIVGYKTKIATILTFAFVVSLDHHNPFVLSYADTLYRLLLFWAIFLPLGERWSVDAVHRDRPPRPSVANVATAAILAQMVFMYFSNGLIKAQSSVWTGGNAAPLVLGMDEMTFLLGDVVRGFPTLLEYGGLLWFYMLLGSWLLIALRGRPRMLMAGLFVGGHLSFALTVRIGAFAYVALAGVLLFLQAQFWDDARTMLAAIGIDTSRLAAHTARLERLAAAVPDYRLTSDRALAAKRATYAAALGIVVVTILFVAAVILFNVAAVVAASGDDDRPVEVRVDESIAETLESSPGVEQVETVASNLGIDQPIGWGVFAGPDPRTEDRYYVFPAETERGERLDVWNDRELSFERPGDQLQRQYGTYRERFYMNSVRRGGDDTDVAPNLAEYTCEQWSAANDDELAYLELYMVGEDVTRETIDSPADRERSYVAIYRHGCGDREPTHVASPPPR